jgi:type I restriction enzyme, S subunit
MNTLNALLGDLALNNSGAFKIGPFGSSLKKSELVSAGIPVVGIENVLPNELVTGFRRFITPEKFQDLADYEIAADDILVTTMGTIGRSAVAPMGLGRAIFDSHLFRMRVDTNRVFPPYLCYALNSNHVASQLNRKARGAIMDGLNTTIFRECSIPLPSVTEQRRIARLLQQANRLRRMRSYTLEMCDKFLPAAFREKFGEPRTNSNKYPRALIEELGAVSTGSTPPRERKEYYGNDVEWIKSDNITLSDIYPSKALEGLSVAGERVGTVVEPGSLLVTCIAGSIASIGNVVLTDRRVAFNQQINAITPHADVDPLFLYALMLVAKPLVQRGATEAMKKMITKGKLEELLLFKPPLPEQQKFAEAVAVWSRMRQTCQESLRQAEHLFQTLLHQTFSAQ